MDFAGTQENKKLRFIPAVGVGDVQEVCWMGRRFFVSVFGSRFFGADFRTGKVDRLQIVKMVRSQDGIHTRF
jgi:hypothetical protein